MVEGIEALEADLEAVRLGELCCLVNRHIEVVHAWAVKGPAASGTWSSRSIWAKQRSVQVWLAITGVAIELEGSGSGVRELDTDTVDAVVLNVHQAVVPKAGERDRQSSCKTSDAGDCPSLSQPISGLE